ncbi:MAG: ABC-F family ATP-binding cassette domain-containing protein [Erysipelotrichaceae bacterium]
MIYQIVNGELGFNGDNLLDKVNFDIRDSQKVALVGRNGCGKTTLLKVIASLQELNKGTIINKGLEIGYLSQISFLDENILVKDELEKVFEKVKSLHQQIKEVEIMMKNDHSDILLNRYASLTNEFEHLNGYNYESEMKTIFSKFGFTNDELYRPLSSFSGGQKTKINFVKLLLRKPDILLLDEPTNHLDLETIEWLEGYLMKYDRALVVVSHDRMFLDNVTNITYELELGKLTKFSGNYSFYVDAKKLILEQEKKLYKNQQEEINRLETLIEKFRYKKNKAAFAQSKIKYLEKMDKVELTKVDSNTFKAKFECEVSGGKRVLTLKDYQIGYNKVLANINLEIIRGQKIGIIGPNGCGKSTLLKSIIHKVPSLGGEMMLGHQIDVGYFDQDLQFNDDENTILEELWQAYPDLLLTKVRNILGGFLFSDDEVFKEVSVLSGGEKVRLNLAKLLLKRANFLILDEPTNHLDILSKEALEESLKGYTGTILMVSHDRYFVSQIANALLVYENGGFVYYPLTYKEYINKEIQDYLVVKEAKEESEIKNDYQNQKEVNRLERLINKKEEELAQLKELTFDEDYYSDFMKYNELQEKIVELEDEINSLLNKWESISN